MHDFPLADQDWIGLMFFKNFADQDLIGFNFFGSGLDSDWKSSQPLISAVHQRYGLQFTKGTVNKGHTVHKSLLYSSPKAV